MASFPTKIPDPLRDRPPYERRRGQCPHTNCGVGVGMSLRDVRRVAPVLASNHAQGPGIVLEEAWTCDLCGQTILELVGYEACADHSAEVWRRMVWPDPLPRKLPEDVPEAIRSLYEEASRAEQAGAYRLAGAGYRSAVEEICTERGATKRTLYDKITELGGTLAPDVITALHETRMVGNDSLHDGLEYAPEEIDDIAALVAEVAEILYIQPAQRRRMAEARQRRREESQQ